MMHNFVFVVEAVKLKKVFPLRVCCQKSFPSSLSLTLVIELQIFYFESWGVITLRLQGSPSWLPVDDK